MTINYEQWPGLGYIIVYFIVCKTTSELEHTILITLYLVGVKNIDNLHAMNEDLQCVFPLDISMVHSSLLAISVDGERLTCDGFSLDYHGGLSLSPMINNSGAAFIDSTHSGPPSSLRAMIEYVKVP
jgi:hypothetical protein